jgi:hypothetical protein
MLRKAQALLATEGRANSFIIDTSASADLVLKYPTTQAIKISSTPTTKLQLRELLRNLILLRI